MSASSDPTQSAQSQVGQWSQDILVAHLLDESGHNVMAFGPQERPENLSFDRLVAWHDADHEPVEGVGPKDGHRHA